MLIAPNILYRIAFLAGAVATFVLMLPEMVRHDAVLTFCGFAPFSDAVFDQIVGIGEIEILGLGIGCAVGGFLIDRIGRYRMLYWGFLFAPLFSGLNGLAFTYWDFLLLRFLASASVAVLLLAAVLLTIEAQRGDVRRLTLVILLAGMVFGSLVAFLVGPVLLRINFLPFDDWRGFLMLQALLALLSLYVRRFHDEPRRWKQDVRDKENKSGFARVCTKISPAAWLELPWEKLAVYALVALALCSGLLAVGRQTTDCIARTDRWNLQASRQADRSLDAALVVYLLRYPQLLDMKEAGQLRLERMPETIARLHDRKNLLPGSIAEALLDLHESSTTVDLNTLFDKGMERVNHRLFPARPALEIPLEEITEYSRCAIAYLNNGQATLEALRLPDTESATGKSTVWQLRMDNLTSLWNGTQEQAEQRFLFVQYHLEAIHVLFLLGGAVFLLLLYCRPNTNLPGLHYLVPLFVLMALFAIRTLSGHAGVQAYYFAPPLGIVAFMLADRLFRLPSCFFKTACRGTSTGLCLMFAILVAVATVDRLTQPKHAAVFFIGLLLLSLVALLFTGKQTRKH